MIIARIIDTVWATRKSESLNGLRFMLAEDIGEIGDRKSVV